jgi:serine/threonine protein kinase/formylglycine-generating enzyme required for sulfatase activity
MIALGIEEMLAHQERGGSAEDLRPWLSREVVDMAKPPDRDWRAAEIFKAALEREAHDRAEFLRDRCGDDDALLQEVESLLAADAAAAGFISASPSWHTIDSRRREADPERKLERSAISPRRIGSYVLLREIGRGGQGVVYLAQDTRLGRLVALKVLSTLVGAISPGALQRFRREAEAASKLDHPGICAVYDAGEADGASYIAMRYVAGESLAKRIMRARSVPSGDGRPLEREPVDAAANDPAPDSESPSGTPSTLKDVMDVVRLIESTARALHEAHEAGLVHRDVKPGNIMITSDGQPIVLDFGLARDESREFSTLTQTGDLLGTPAYMSPEQLDSKRLPIDRRTDVYSLGVTLYESLTLKRPFDAPSSHEIYRKILSSDAPDPTRLNPRVSKDLRVVIETAIEKDPARRYATALEFADDLARVARREPVRARPAGPLRRLRLWTQRNPVLATLLLVLSIGLATSLVLLDSVRSGRDQVLRLADVARLRDLVAEADALWPANPQHVEALKNWIVKARNLADRLPLHRERRDALRQRALGGEGAGMSEPRNFRFRDIEDQWQHDTIAKLVEGIESLTQDDPSRAAITIRSVTERLAFAERVARDTVDAARERWDAAIASIANERECPAYHGLRITPQLGLIPVGRDASSGLWEFGHLESGTIPERDGTGKLRLAEKCGIVFVLIPGGPFTMGSPTGETDHRDDERMHEVALAPFFVSKFEMTQGQWETSVGGNPSYYRALETHASTRATFQSPVESVSWKDCTDGLRKLGLALPTEAQWECAARGGTRSAWWTGDDRESLRGKVNIADQAAKRSGAQWEEIADWPDFDDGFSATAPAGTFPANPFGVHEILGNVWEWCREPYGAYGTERPGDGERPDPPSNSYLLRGGGFDYSARFTRCALRFIVNPDLHEDATGVRPVRALDAGPSSGDGTALRAPATAPGSR